jgi:transketolase
MSIDMLCINTIRTLAMDAIQKANSGHPGLPMGAAPMAHMLWQYHLQHNPKDPSWPDRDRFVLSGGHGSSLLYALLHMTGYDSVTLNDIRDFRQWQSATPGHPEFGHTAGVESTTGPLGQGAANAVGMAIAESWLAQYFNRPDYTVVDHYTYALVTDGDIMEGIGAESASLAGHLKLGKLIYLYDANDITLDGPMAMHCTEDVGKRYEACGWHVQTVSDGDNDLASIDRAIQAARAEKEKPSMIVIKTTIGYGSPNRAGTSKVHGSPLGDQELGLTKQALGWDPKDRFFIPEEALTQMRSAVNEGAEAQQAWNRTFAGWCEKYPELAVQWNLAWSGELPEGWDADLPTWDPDEAVATRVTGGKVQDAIAAKVPWLVGGDADLSCSTQSAITGEADFNGQAGAGRNIRYGIREHMMAAAANGIAYHGGMRTFASTFFVFSDYMRPSVRLAAMNKLPAIYFWTHDSVAVGEDGPTHQPIEHLMALRQIPNLYIMRPADGNESREAWRFAMLKTDAPTGLVFSRQALPSIDPSQYAGPEGLHKGAYVLAEASGDTAKAIVLATGSEVCLALDARNTLEAQGIPTRVVSMPCFRLFGEQDKSYRDAVLPPEVKARVSIEAGTTLGWDRYIGDNGIALGIDTFGASAPGGTVMKEYGMTAEAIVGAVRKLVG